MRQRQQVDTAGVEEITLTPSECTMLLVGLYKAGNYYRTQCLTGSPGCGKTSAVRAAAQELAKIYPGFGYEEINPTMPADEVGGIPDLIRVEGHATMTDYALPKWFGKLDPDWKGIICLDDALQGDRLMQQTLANLILARNLRGHALPKGAMIVATGNRVEDKAGVTKTLSHLADRMCTINVKTEPTSWVDNFAIPKGIDERVIAYIMRDKSKLDMFDPNLPKCATSRTWEAISGHLRYIDTLNGPGLDQVRNKMAQALLSGEIGMGEAISFHAFCGMFGRLPDIDDLLKNPSTAKVDYELDIQYALAISIAQRIDGGNFGAALEYIDRIGPDLTTVAIKLATKAKPELKTAPAWQAWAIKNQDVVYAH